MYGAEMRVSVLGSGSWGTTVASLTAHRNDTVVWSRRQDTADEINERHVNTAHLDGYDLHPNLSASSDFEKICARADVLVMGVPSDALRATAERAATFVPSGIPIVSLTKGLEAGTHLRMSQVIAEAMPGHPVGALTGPNLAKEIMAGCAAASVVAIDDDEIGSALQNVFRTPLFRVYRHHDVAGCELGGALKNVVALATGIAEGLSVGDNTRSMVITRGHAELTRLGVALGGEAETFAGLTGMGDLIATCVSNQSRNRHVGEQLGRGRPLDEIIAEMSSVAEGVKVAPVVAELAERHGVSMPVCTTVHRVVAGEIPAAQAYAGLMRSHAGHESEPAM